MIARADALAAMQSDEFDVVVIGGGITGAGVALDAASRGYSVALVEKSDYSSGTSSRSSKLVHGGLRYLQNFDLGLVREALVERQLMVNLAPHLVKPLPLLIPAFDGKHPDRKSGVGLNLYDVMSRERRGSRRRGTGPRPRVLEPRAPPHGGCRRDAGDAARAGAARAHLGLPVLRLPDRRHAGWCSPCSARPSASARCAPTRSRSRGWSSATAAPPGCCAATPWAAASSS